MRVQEAIAVDKSQLAYYPFKREEVLEDTVDRSLRKYDLERAVALGNLYKSSVTIFFKNIDNETRSVTGTVWALTSKFVSLKGNLTLPINAIIRVQV